MADRLEKEGNQSQYLTAHSEDVILVKENGDRVYGGPVGEERNTINQRFDTMFWELKEMGILCWRNMEKDIGKVSKVKKKNSSRSAEG